MAATAVAAKSSLRSASTWMSFTDALIRRAVLAGLSHVGNAETSGRVGDVNAMTAASMTSPDPVPTSTFFGSTPKCFAIAAVRSGTLVG